MSNEVRFLKEVLDTLRSAQGVPKAAVMEYLKNASGDVDAVTDYSGTPLQYYYEPASSKNVAITDLTVQITHGSEFADDKYGGLTALSPGIELKVLAGSNMSSTALDLLDGAKITNNADWARIAERFEVADYGVTVGGRTLHARLHWSSPIVLNGADSDRLAVIINGVCNALTDHSFFAQGFEF